MASKFDMIIESSMRRYNQNTLIVGDRIKFVDNYKNHEWFRKQAALKLERLEEMINSGDNLRISAVKTVRPQTAESGHFEIVDAFYYDVVREAAPGFYSQVFTVPQDLVEWLDDYPNLSGETPDGQKRSDTSNIKPELIDGTGDDANLSLKRQTRCDHPDKDMPTTNTSMDNVPAPKDGTSYTQNYMEG
tara:strand:+ start:292 stop:858 length:567 start_codon:yes stop_codon:yes gene_type:complete